MHSRERVAALRGQQTRRHLQTNSGRPRTPCQEVRCLKDKSPPPSVTLFMRRRRGALCTPGQLTQPPAHLLRLSHTQTRTLLTIELNPAPPRRRCRSASVLPGNCESVLLSNQETQNTSAVCFVFKGSVGEGWGRGGAVLLRICELFFLFLFFLNSRSGSLQRMN